MIFAFALAWASFVASIVSQGVTVVRARSTPGYMWKLFATVVCS